MASAEWDRILLDIRISSLLLNYYSNLIINVLNFSQVQENTQSNDLKSPLPKPGKYI